MEENQPKRKQNIYCFRSSQGKYCVCICVCSKPWERVHIQWFAGRTLSTQRQLYSQPYFINTINKNRWIRLSLEESRHRLPTFPLTPNPTPHSQLSHTGRTPQSSSKIEKRVQPRKACLTPRVQGFYWGQVM